MAYTRFDISSHDKARKLRAVLEKSPQLAPVSRDVHWYVVSSPAVERAEPKIFLSPYVDVGTGTSVDVQLLSSYVNNLAESALNPLADRVAPKLIEEYLRIVAALSEVESVSTGGMIVAVDSTGSIQYTVIRDLRELSLQHRQHIALESRRQNALQQAFDRTRDELAREHKRRTPGLEL